MRRKAISPEARSRDVISRDKRGSVDRTDRLLDDQQSGYYPEMSIDCLSRDTPRGASRNSTDTLRLAIRATQNCLPTNAFRAYCCLLLPRGFRKSCRIK